jgi:hypothetical protein
MISVHKQSLVRKLIGKIELLKPLQGSPLLPFLLRQVRQLVVRSPNPVRFQLLRYNSLLHTIECTHHWGSFHPMVLSEVHETTDDACVLEPVEATSATLPRHVHLPLSLSVARCI